MPHENRGNAQKGLLQHPRADNVRWMTNSKFGLLVTSVDFLKSGVLIRDASGTKVRAVGPLQFQPSKIAPSLIRNVQRLLQLRKPMLISDHDSF